MERGGPSPSHRQCILPSVRTIVRVGKLSGGAGGKWKDRKKWKI